MNDNLKNIENLIETALNKIDNGHYESAEIRAEVATAMALLEIARSLAIISQTVHTYEGDAMIRTTNTSAY